MSALTRTELRRRLRMRPEDDGLVITPLLSEKQVGDSSIDVRLGAEFLSLTKYTTAAQTHHAIDGKDSRGYLSTRRDDKRPFFLHPGHLVLGATFEFIAVPGDLMCYVMGRSSLGRTGLVIATATAVAPGFRGCITLEITNLGEVPLELFPGMRIAHLVFHNTKGRAKYEGRFLCATGPQPPMLSHDPEMKIWDRRDSSTHVPSEPELRRRAEEEPDAQDTRR